MNIDGITVERALSDKISEWIYNNISTLFIAASVSGVLSLSGILFLSFGSDFRSFFPANSELITSFDDTLEQYEQGETMLFYLKLPNKGDITKANINTIQYTNTLLNTLPNVRYVRSLSSYQKPISSEDSIDSKPLGEWALESNNLDEFHKYLADTTQLKGRLVSDDHSGALVIAQLDLVRDENRYRQVSDIATKAEEMALDIQQKFPDVEVYISGTVAFDDGLVSEFFNFSFITMPLTIFLVSFLVAWVYGSYWILSGGLVASGLTLGATAGIFGWLPVTFDPTSATGLILVFTLTVVDCIHLAGIYRVCLRQSMTKEEALKEAIRANLKPIFFTTLTTGVGLMTLFISGSPPFILFAQVALIGIVVGFAYTFILGLGVLYWAPVPDLDKKLFNEHTVELTKQLVLKKPKEIISIFSVIALSALLALPYNKIDEDVKNYFTPATDFDAATEILSEDFRSESQLTIDLAAEGNQLIITPQVFLAIDDFEKWLNLRSDVVSTFTSNDIIREIKNLWDNTPGVFELPKTQEEYSQLLLVYEMSLTLGQSTSEFISPNRTRTLMSVFTDDLSNSEFIALQSDISNWWMQRGIKVSISGRDLIFAKLATNTVHNAMIGGGIASLLITLFMMYAFRSVKWGLFSLIPNTLPFILLFGLWGAFYGEISQATCLAFTIVLGFVVDDSIHFIMKFKDAKKDLPIDEAIIKTFNIVGFGITATTLIFIGAGFVMAASSQFIPNVIVGVFIFSIVIFAWLFDLLFMPALLLLYFRRKESIQPFSAVTLYQTADEPHALGSLNLRDSH